MTLPYLPSGVEFLPANRFILFADSDNLIQRLDESAKTLNGVSFTGWWESNSLNKQALNEGTLNLLTIVYSATNATTLTVRVSGDGGETWNQTRVIDLPATLGGRVARVRRGFNTTGFDLRIRLELDTDEVISLFELHPEIVVRGQNVIG